MIGDWRSDIQALKTTIYGQSAVNSDLRIIMNDYIVNQFPEIVAIVQTIWQKADVAT